MYGTDLSNEENAEFMMRMFVGLPAEVITQEVSKIHEEFSKFFCAEYFDNESDNNGCPLALLRGIRQGFIDFQNRCVRATNVLSRLVIETAGQRPATLKDLRAQELVLDMQTRLLELGENSSPSAVSRRKSLRRFAASKFEKKALN